MWPKDWCQGTRVQEFYFLVQGMISSQFADVAELAKSLLNENPYPPLRAISCVFGHGVLTLEGCLPSFYLKQVAQEAVAQIAEVERVENHIAVMATPSRPACPASSSSRPKPELRNPLP